MPKKAAANAIYDFGTKPRGGMEIDNDEIKKMDARVNSSRTFFKDAAAHMGKPWA